MKTIYYICNHFTELITYHDFCTFLKKHFPNTKHHLILIEAPYLSLISHSHILEKFDFIITLPHCECSYTNRWYIELLPHNLFNQLRSVKKFTSQIKPFTFNEDSLIIISEMTETTLPTRLLLNKVHKETTFSKILRIGTCYHRSKNCNTNSRISWILHNVYTIIGAYPVSVHFYGWMVAERRYYNEQNIIDRFLVLSNQFKSHKNYMEIKYPHSTPLKPQHPRYVFFFDDGLGWTNLIRKMSSKQWILTMNQILQSITDLYKNENVVLLFKTHPANKHNIPYKLAGFKTHENNITAETIYSTCSEKIRAVYSVASTSARYADLYGIPTYVFFKLFNFPEEIMNRHKRYLLDFSKVESIKNLETLKLPTTHRVTTNTPDKLLQTFRRILNEHTNID